MNVLVMQLSEGVCAMSKMTSSTSLYVSASQA